MAVWLHETSILQQITPTILHSWLFLPLSPPNTKWRSGYVRLAYSDILTENTLLLLTGIFWAHDWTEAQVQVDVWHQYGGVCTAWFTQHHCIILYAQCVLYLPINLVCSFYLYVLCLPLT